jgi:hypothetical protein
MRGNKNKTMKIGESECEEKMENKETYLKNVMENNFKM